MKSVIVNLTISATFLEIVYFDIKLFYIFLTYSPGQTSFKLPSNCLQTAFKLPCVFCVFLV